MLLVTRLFHHILEVSLHKGVKYISINHGCTLLKTTRNGRNVHRFEKSRVIRFVSRPPAMEGVLLFATMHRLFETKTNITNKLPDINKYYK